MGAVRVHAAAEGGGGVKRQLYFHTYQDLPGKPGKTKCRTAVSVAEALRLLKRGTPIDAAGETGALNGYRDQEGMWRGEFFRRLKLLSDERFGSLEDLDGWLQKWFPELGDQEKEARL